MTDLAYDLDDCPDLSQFADLAKPNLFGVDPAVLRADLLEAVKEGIAAHPRSQQKEIGPSQVGHPCNRWLAYFFAGVPATGLQAPMWRAAVGTATHDYFTDWMHRWNEVHGLRYLADTRVYVGELYPGRPITGKLDCFDLWTCTVVDLKVPGPSSMKRHASPSAEEDPQYAVQFDCYGVGATNAGLTTRNVGSLRLPSAGELSDAIWKVRPHEPERARTALARAGGIARMAEVVGPESVKLQPATEHHCRTCEWFLPGSTDLTKGCPGAESFQAARDTPPAALTALAGAQPPEAVAAAAPPASIAALAAV